MANLAHGRQTGLTLSQIRADHLNRYYWAAERLKGATVLDAGCGIGYGSFILAEAGCKVFAVDADPGAISLARTHYDHSNITHKLMPVEKILPHWDERGYKAADAVVCFEVLEHVSYPSFLLRLFRKLAPRLLCSVPNEDVMPFEETRPLGHLRHYTPDQFAELLSNGGAYRRLRRYHQKGRLSDIEPGWEGRTLIADLRL